MAGLNYDDFKGLAEYSLEAARKEPPGSAALAHSQAMVYAILALAEAIRGKNNLHVTLDG